MRVLVAAVLLALSIGTAVAEQVRLSDDFMASYRCAARSPGTLIDGFVDGCELGNALATGRPYLKVAGQTPESLCQMLISALRRGTLAHCLAGYAEGQSIAWRERTR